MLKYKLIDSTTEYVTYRYFPEGNNEFGEITVSKIDKTIQDSKIASTDEFKWYFLKMYKRIAEFIDKGEFIEIGKIAWY